MAKRVKLPRLKGFRTAVSAPGLPEEVFLYNGYVPGDARLEACMEYEAKHKLGMFGAPMIIRVEETTVQRGAPLPGLIIEEIR